MFWKVCKIEKVGSYTKVGYYWKKCTFICIIFVGYRFLVMYYRIQVTGDDIRLNQLLHSWSLYGHYGCRNGHWLDRWGRIV